MEIVTIVYVYGSMLFVHFHGKICQRSDLRQFILELPSRTTNV